AHARRPYGPRPHVRPVHHPIHDPTRDDGDSSLVERQGERAVEPPPRERRRRTERLAHGHARRIFEGRAYFGHPVDTEYRWEDDARRARPADRGGERLCEPLRLALQ